MPNEFKFRSDKDEKPATEKFPGATAFFILLMPQKDGTFVFS